MNKSLFISIAGMLVLVLFQIYWLTNLYSIHKTDYNMIISEELEVSIKKELTIRRSEEFKDPQHPRFQIRAMEDMTLEEISSYKGDTIILKSAEEANVGNNIADIIAQSFQDEAMISNPIKLSVLDSIYHNQLQEKGIPTRYRLLLHNKHQKTTDSTLCMINEKNSIQTSLFPIGTQGLLYVSAKVEMPSSLILQRMSYSLIVSLLMILIVLYCLYYQLTIIRRTAYTLQEREKAIHCIIHDLKAPLNTAYTIIDYIAINEKDDKKKQILQTGKAHVRILTDTIESMLSFIKNKGKVKMILTEINLSEIIKHVNEELILIHPTKKYTFQLENQLPYTYIYTDKIWLERCLRNLLENALKYSDDNVQITVSITEMDKHIKIAVKDTGWGIPQKAQKKLGKQFYQTEHSRRKIHSGYGIGLSSVTMLVKEMGGTFKFHSQEGVGSTFFIILPANKITDKT